MRNLGKAAAVVFITAAIVNLGSIALGWRIPTGIAKVLLMPSLCLAGLSYVKEKRIPYILALLFGTIGDAFLIFHGQTYFMLGMAAFLIGHCFYIYIFTSRIGKVTPDTLGRKVDGAVMTIGQSVAMYATIAAAIFGVSLIIGMTMTAPAEMLTSVKVYAAALVILSGIGLWMWIVDSRKWAWLFFGALIFLFSDSLIGFHKFAGLNFPFRGVAVMFTYIIAQFLMTVAVIKTAKN